MPKAGQEIVGGSGVQPGVVFVRPVVRRATLLRVRGITQSLAERWLQTLIDDWPKVERRILATISKSFDTAASSESFYLANPGTLRQEEPRLGTEGRTLVLDLPRMQARPVGDPNSVFRSPVDARVCVAVCTGTQSTKIWARAGLPIDPACRPMRLGLEHLRNALVAFDSVVNSLRELVVRWVLHRAPDPLRVYCLPAPLEVIAVGTSDAALRNLDAKVSAGRLRLADLLTTREALCPYFESVLGDTADDPMDGSDSSPRRWFSTSVDVDIRERDSIRPRSLVCRLETDTDRIRAIGVGYDDSRGGELAQKASLYLARWLGARI